MTSPPISEQQRIFGCTLCLLQFNQDIVILSPDDMIHMLLQHRQIICRQVHRGIPCHIFQIVILVKARLSPPPASLEGDGDQTVQDTVILGHVPDYRRIPDHPRDLNHTAHPTRAGVLPEVIRTRKAIPDISRIAFAISVFFTGLLHPFFPSVQKNLQRFLSEGFPAGLQGFEP